MGEIQTLREYLIKIHEIHQTVTGNFNVIFLSKEITYHTDTVIRDGIIIKHSVTWQPTSAYKSSVDEPSVSIPVKVNTDLDKVMADGKHHENRYQLPFKHLENKGRVKI